MDITILRDSQSQIADLYDTILDKHLRNIIYDWIKKL